MVGNFLCSYPMVSVFFLGKAFQSLSKFGYSNDVEILLALTMSHENFLRISFYSPYASSFL